MSAHEEKISNKRRKLFKALSAVPVVATFGPGEALANTSSIQCAAKIRAGDPAINIPDLVTGIKDNDGTEQEGVFVRNRTAWMFSTDSRIADPDNPGSYRDFSAINGISEADLAAGFFLVAVGAGLPDLTDPYETGVDGEEGNGPYVATNDARTQIDARAIVFNGGNISIQVDGVDVLTSASEGRLGGFAVIGHTVAVDEADDRMFVIDSIYPADIPSGGTTPGSLQAMNGTCLDSFKLAGNGGNDKLTIG